MPTLVIVRLRPKEPTSGAAFSNALAGLTVTAFDLSFGDTVGGIQLGSASGVFTSSTVGDDTVDVTVTGILQHYFDDSGMPAQRLPQAAATAVIVASPPAGHPEYPAAASFDLRLQLERGGQPIADGRIDANATVVTVGSLSTDADDYIAMAPSAYATVPAANTGAGAQLDLPDDGTPPNFAAMVAAVDAVLALDPADGQTLAQRDQLTVAEAKLVASELVWDRVLSPPPAEPRPLAQMYTSPPDDPSVDEDEAENDRLRFEAELDAYHATNDALALRLAGFVYAASAAMVCERLSAGENVTGPLGPMTGARRALLTFPLITGASDASTMTQTAVLLDGSPAGSVLNPAFVVPAAHFYALGAQLPPQVDAAQRYAMALADAEAKILVALQAALESGMVAATEPPVAAAVPATPVGAAQSARRLRAIGRSAPGAPDVPLAAPVSTLVGSWLAHAGPTGTIDEDFWVPEVAANPGAAAYLDLLLHVITDNFAPLMAAIAAPPLSVASVADLVAVTDEQWRALFLPPGAAPRLDLLPPFTLVGPSSTPADQVEVFIRRLRMFFSVPYAPPAPVLAPSLAPPLFPAAVGDVLARFVAAYATAGGGSYTVGGPHDATAAATAVQATLPGDPAAMAWLVQLLAVLDELHQLTGFAPAELRFSLMEALYARGFTSAASVQELSPDELRRALEGSVAYPYAADIQNAAGGSTASPTGPAGPFHPVNADGDLTDCVPPEHLSPFGAMAYLHELLRASPSSTCEQPLTPGAQDTIGALLAARRGQLGDLAVTAANLSTPLPAIDLVNESLEALAASVAGGGSGAGGAVFDTAADELAGHSLAGSSSDGHAPAELFAALPEHSAPDAVDVAAAATAAYAALAADVSSPSLPYDQPVDVVRGYLEQAGTSRFEAMRRFRRDITEFVLDPAPASEPSEFGRHLWRYPVRLDIALEYLCVGAQEYEIFFGERRRQRGSRGRRSASQQPWQHYGFPSSTVGDVDWTDIVTRVDELLPRIGLDYCDLVDLQRSGIVPFVVRHHGNRHDDRGNGGDRDGERGDGEDGVGDGRDDRGQLPECPPCCLEDLRVVFTDGDTAVRRPEAALVRLALVARLNRRLRDRCGGGLTFQMLADLDEVLHLFQADGSPNPEFLRQLAALLMLADELRLPLCADCGCELPENPGPADRMPLLALWGAGGPQHRARAIELLVDAIGDTAEHAEPQLRVTPELAKLVVDNLDPLSRLCGFDPDTASDTWHAAPTHTLRFAEVLLKIYRSPFTVGELMFLFTTGDHLPGDDPLPLQDRNEALQDPLGLGDAPYRGDGQHGGDAPHSLWALRDALRAVDVPDDERQAWTWPRIVAALHADLGYTPQASGPDPLVELGRLYFGDTVNAIAAQRRFEVSLPAASTSPQMWAGGPPQGPFDYDPVAGTLSATLPMPDAGVLDRLLQLRPLNPAERDAVRELYFAPRAAFAPFAAIFENPVAGIEQLIHAPDGERFDLFRRAFALFHRRCTVLAEHLAGHVLAATESDAGQAPVAEAWRVLRALWADENFGRTPWEDDSGAPPEVTWTPKPSGGAFAAILGVLGTGLVGEYRAPASCEDPRPLLWRELRGPLAAWGEARDERNAPVPTIIPALDFELTAEQTGYVALRNGLALLDATGEPLGGAQPFAVRWTGVLLVERDGVYRFHAGGRDEHDDCEGRAWRLLLRRGQRSWTVLNKDFDGEPAPDRTSGALRLRRGAYEITVDMEQREPTFDRPEEVCPTRTGFRIAYSGPDTGDEVTVLPFDKLFLATRDATLRHGVDLPDDTDSDGTVGGGSAAGWLDGLYTSTLRDARRTYQRAFKGLLLAHRFGLSAEPVPAYRQSELGYLLDHPAAFAGTAHPRTGASTFGTHRAWLALDLLPVADPYPPPAVLAQPSPPYPAVPDQRSDPSAQRRAALFDVWERLHDYRQLRRETREARDRPAWLLFAEVTEQQPDDPVQLLRHLGIDLRYAPLVASYFVAAPDPSPYALLGDDLADERWAVRAWRGDRWLERLCGHVFPLAIGRARPQLWAADQPGVATGAPPESGTANLTRFLQDAYLENGEPRRYTDLRQLNDCLRVRARDALLAYLCGMDRVALPWSPGSFAREPRELSDLLLQDVDAGLCLRLSRVEDAVSAVQAFVQRAVLGLEPLFPVGSAFLQLWQRRFATFREWQACVRREVYRENWIEWDELRLARRSEAFTMLEERLRENTLSIAVPGGLSWWPGPRPPRHPCLELLQDGQPAPLSLLQPVPEGLGLLGSPERETRPSWLAPVLGPGVTDDRPDDDNPDDDNPDGDNPDGDQPDNPGGDGPGVPALLAAPGAVESTGAPGERLPIWLEAAISLGAPFIRVAAAGVPGGWAHHVARGRPGGCCSDCGCEHEPLVDEYYFWLGGSRLYTDAGVEQDAESGVVVSTEVNPADQTSDWNRPEKLPALLDWQPEQAVHLWWCRVHDGQFQQPRRSTDGVLLAAGQAPVPLQFHGRTGDSLRFSVPGAPVPVGHADPAPPGFRYDLVPDSAVVLPLVAAPVPAPPFPGGLETYPYFAFVSPGAPLVPLSPFAVAMTVAGALRAHCSLEAALAWYELAYPPLSSDNTWAVCDDDRPRPDLPGDDLPGNDLPHGDLPHDVRPHDDRRRRTTGDVTCCPSSPVDATTARRRAVLLAYLETLLQSADGLLCKGSVEAAQLGRVVLDAMAALMGPAPRRIAARDDGQPATVATFVPRPAPLNPRLLALYERREDRYALVRRCLDGRRLRRGQRLDAASAAFWADTDPRDGWLQACDCDCGGSCGECCTTPYRFTFLVQKALDLAGEVRALGAGLLAAYEKGDAEALTALRSTNERQLVELGVRTRQLQWREADWQVQALEKTKQGALARLAYFQRLLRNGNNAGEIGYEAATTVSLASRAASNISEGIAQGIGMSPDFWMGVAGIMGSPLQFNQFPLGNKLAAGFSTAARITNSLAEMASTTGAFSLTEGGWQRRTEEWQHQVELITIELQQIERQILAAQRRRDAALRDLNTQQKQAEHAAEVHDFLRDKFTGTPLYLYLQRETAALHRQLGDLALDWAGRAQRAFGYERATNRTDFLPEPGWHGLHEGLMAGERLHTALRRMESAYFDENCREYELGKNISLRAEFPAAFLQLQQTGVTEIELPEWLFDVDYPGHYLRRIKNVTLTIPCVVGPYTGVHCRLTLLSSQTRVDPRLATATQPCCGDCGDPCCRSCDEPAGGPCRCRGGGLVRRCPCATGTCMACRATVVDESAGYPAGPDDPRIVRTYAAREAIATSTGQNDSGLFELNFRDERYLPFEFRGAVSRWRIELPPENNRFDLDTLGDVVMHLNYTAREGGERLRDAARIASQGRLPGNGVRLFDLRHDFPDEWYRMQATEPDLRASWPLRLGREHFPYLPGGCDLRVVRMELFVEVGDPGCLGVLPVRFVPRHDVAHGPGDECACAGHDVNCVASADWPCLFHGVLELDLPTIGRHRDRSLGEFRFPPVPDGVTSVYLLCGYQEVHRGRC